MITISLCMIVKNEEETLARCLDSVKDAVDEIVIVDTGSTDQTREIAGRYTGRVYDFAWVNDFAAARNFAFSKGEKDYLMWLDADDILKPEDARKLIQLKQTLSPEVDMVLLPYHTAFDGQGRPTFLYYRERLVRRNAGFYWEGAVHEVIAPRGRILTGDAAVTHQKPPHRTAGQRNLQIYEQQLREGKKLSPRDRFYYARELTYAGRDADAALVLENFLSSPEGWVENKISACMDLAGCYERLGKDGQRLFSLLRSLAFDSPRAEVCCELGRYFLAWQKYAQAAFWYETALTRPRSDQTGGFALAECYGYLPCIQLCICYDRMGDREKAEEYNERAARYQPEDPYVQKNREYFKSCRERRGEG